MGELLRQVRIVPQGTTTGVSSCDQPFCDLAIETNSFITDLSVDPDVQSRKIKIESSLPTSADLALAHIPPIAFYRILENLVRNAIEAIQHDHGKILISLTMNKGNPELIIQDNGSGISLDIRDKILAFDFTTKPARGTGLGLGIVDKICKEFGATLRFESKVGTGTTFIVSFKPTVLTTHQSELPFGEVSYGQI